MHFISRNPRTQTTVINMAIKRILENKANLLDVSCVSTFSEVIVWNRSNKNTKRQVNELCFPACVILPFLSPQLAFYLLVKLRWPDKKSKAKNIRVNHLF